MWRVFITVICMAIAACAQIPPSSRQIQEQKMQAEPGKEVVYIVQHSVSGIRGSPTDAGLHKVDARTGRRLVTSGTLCCASN